MDNDTLLQEGATNTEIEFFNIVQEDGENFSLSQEMLRPIRMV